jgi:hypothetical protein
MQPFSIKLSKKYIIFQLYSQKLEVNVGIGKIPLS